MHAIGIQYSDGFSYSKGKLEEAYREIADKVPAKPHKDPAVAALKKEDIDLVVRASSSRFHSYFGSIPSSWNGLRTNPLSCSCLLA